LLPLPLAGKAVLGDDAAFHLTHQPWE
jgi:hypothetical protein